MVTDYERREFYTSPSTLLPPPFRLLWECAFDPALGWIVMAVDTKTQDVKFVLTLSKQHQHATEAERICRALARLYNT